MRCFVVVADKSKSVPEIGGGKSLRPDFARRHKSAIGVEVPAEPCIDQVIDEPAAGGFSMGCVVEWVGYILDQLDGVVGIIGWIKLVPVPDKLDESHGYGNRRVG